MINNSQLSAIRTCILEAGDAIMEIYKNAEVGVDKKADDSPVTAADIAADKIIYEKLRELFPNEHIVTEEISDSHKLKASSFFIVDPLDGTKEFIHKRGDFTVNIGYVKDGVPVFGMVYAPAKDRLFYTQDDQTIEETAPFEKDKIGEQNAVNVKVADNTALKVVASKSHLSPETEDYIAKYDVANFNSAGSSLKFCLVATGEADFYPRLGPTMEWDTAAADALVRGAGGQVLDFETLTPLQYGKPEFRNDYFLVIGKGLDLKA